MNLARELMLNDLIPRHLIRRGMNHIPMSVSEWLPASFNTQFDLDLHETPNKYTVSADLPGMKREEMKVYRDGDRLVVSGERMDEKVEEKDDGRYHFSERRYGSFTRSIQLPSDASREVTASYADGVLTVTVPKIELSERSRFFAVIE